MIISQVTFNSRFPLCEQVQGDSFVLIDEADTILLDHAATLPNKQVIGLSATVMTPELQVENKFLERCKFVFKDSKIPGYIDT